MLSLVSKVNGRLTLLSNAHMRSMHVVESEWRQSWRVAQADASKKSSGTTEKDGRGALIIIGKQAQDKFFSNGAFVECEGSIYDFVDLFLRSRFC